MNDQLSDEYLVKEIKENKDNDSLKELISRHSGIYVEMIRRYGQKHLTDMQLNDLMDEKDFNIYVAALDHNHEKSKFSTYLANRTRYHCLTNKTINKTSSKIVNFDDVEFEQEAKEEEPDISEEYRELINKIRPLIEETKDPRVTQIFNERYFLSKTSKPKSWKAIAKEVGVSVQGCIDIHNRTIKFLKRKLKNDAITF